MMLYTILRTIGAHHDLQILVPTLQDQMDWMTTRFIQIYILKTSDAKQNIQANWFFNSQMFK